MIKLGTSILVLTLLSACGSVDDNDEVPEDNNDPETENQDYNDDINNDSENEDQNDNIQNNNEDRNIPYKDRSHKEHDPNTD